MKTRVGMWIDHREANIVSTALAWSNMPGPPRFTAGSALTRRMSVLFLCDEYSEKGAGLLGGGCESSAFLALRFGDFGRFVLSDSKKCPLFHN